MYTRPVDRVGSAREAGFELLGALQSIPAEDIPKVDRLNVVAGQRYLEVDSQKSLWVRASSSL